MTETANPARDQLLQLIQPQEGRGWPTYEYAQLMHCESAPRAVIYGTHLFVPGFCRVLEWVEYSLSGNVTPSRRMQDYCTYMRLRQAAIAAADCTISVVLAQSGLTAIPPQFRRAQLHRLIHFAQSPRCALRVVPDAIAAGCLHSAISRITFVGGGTYSESDVDSSNPEAPHETWAASGSQQYAAALAWQTALRSTLGSYDPDATCKILLASP